MAVGRLLRERGKKLGTAESCTGGNIARLIASVPGSSDYFVGSVVSYANSVKTQLLGVDDKLIEDHGAVSEPVVIAMAEGARTLLSVDYAVATSGIAGPDGGTESKPVGTLWAAVSSASGTIASRHTFGSDRITNINRFSNVALNMLRNQIIND
jgi:nicotinamide-nucleotide amidase